MNPIPWFESFYLVIGVAIIDLCTYYLSIAGKGNKQKAILLSFINQKIIARS